jgi:hypothetical protein
MKTLIQDPYLHTVKRTLQDRRYKELYQKKKSNQIDSFMKKEVDITEYINLSKEMANTLLFISFLVVPYIVGIAFAFFIIARVDLDTFWSMNLKEYMIYWAIGYEVIATVTLLMIFKSAINFKPI